MDENGGRGMTGQAAQYRIGELAALTGVQAGTIRFYEKCGFLEPVERLPNRYRLFHSHHIYQIRICRLVFGGFVNKNLRKISLRVIAAAKRWDLEGYEEAAQTYRQAVCDDIARTKKAIALAMENLAQGKEKAASESSERYSKKQAAELLGVSGEAIRNWERNGLLPQGERYQKRFYDAAALERMYVIRLLLDTGYSIMAILRFLAAHDGGQGRYAANLLLSPEESEDLKYRADRYLEALEHLKTKAETLCRFSEEMRNL